MNFRPLPIAAILFSLSSATATDFTLLSAGAPARAFIPTAAQNNASGYIWRTEPDPANVASWLSGTTGVGYDTNPNGGGDYTPQIGLNVGAMQNVNGSVFVRIPFTVNAAQRPLFQTLMLRMRFEDGFVAYINGTKVTSSGEPATLDYNSLVLNGTAIDANLTAWTDFDITQHLGLLHDGVNMLAIQGLNATIGSSDLLIVPQIVASDIIPPPPPRWPSPVFTTVPGTSPLTRPIFIRNAGDGSNKLYIGEQRGVISFLSGGTKTQFLDISGPVLSSADGGGNEQGLFGLAFPPGFAQSRRFYVSYSGAGNALTLSRFRTQTGNPALGDSTTEQILLTIPHTSASNHNGGDIHFGKDGMLYWSTGDGGVQNDPANNAQNTSILLGKILRLDVEGNATGGPLIPASNPYTVAGDGVLDQIYHIGMRNPWRWSFDRETGDMWVGDVGQYTWEEVSVIPANTGAANLQWRRQEGLHDFNLTSPYGPGVLIAPAVEKPRSDISVTGGYVYRGRAFPRMNGLYFYGDYGSGRFYGVQKDSTGVWVSTTLRADCTSVSTFGEDEAGEIYWANHSAGLIFRIDDGGSDSAWLSIVSHTVSPAGRLAMTWGAANGRSYVPEVSTDMVTWTAAGPPQTGTGTFRLTFAESADPPAGTGRRYFRAREL